jgi:DNA-directed RNA polymerase I, II, and III subunit RPABC2
MRLTKYEKTRLLGTRALQIAMNAPLMIDPGAEVNPLRIAIMEFEAGVFPLKLVRTLPDGRVVELSVNEPRKA